MSQKYILYKSEQELEILFQDLETQIIDLIKNASNINHELIKVDWWGEQFQMWQNATKHMDSEFCDILTDQMNYGMCCVYSTFAMIHNIDEDDQKSHEVLNSLKHHLISNIQNYIEDQQYKFLDLFFQWVKEDKDVMGYHKPLHLYEDDMFRSLM